MLGVMYEEKRKENISYVSEKLSNDQTQVCLNEKADKCSS